VHIFPMSISLEWSGWSLSRINDKSRVYFRQSMAFEVKTRTMGWKPLAECYRDSREWGGLKQFCRTDYEKNFVHASSPDYKDFRAA
jgi:hypothetical protein